MQTVLHAKAFAVAGRLLGDLLRELARRREHQDARRRHPVACRSGAYAGCGEPLERRQHECRRLAGAGLRGADEIAPREQQGNRLCLDRRGFGVAARAERLQQLRRELQFIECHVHSFKRSARATRAGRARAKNRASPRRRPVPRKSGMTEQDGAVDAPRAIIAVRSNAAGARVEPQPGRQTAKPSSLTGCRRSDSNCRENEPRD